MRRGSELKFRMSVALATGCLCLVSAFGSNLPAKKYLAHGWEWRHLRPRDVLMNLDKFKDVAYDGVTMRVNVTNSQGQLMRSLVDGVRWERAALQSDVADMRELLGKEHFRESFLSAYSAPQKRMSWTDDAAWKTIEDNMAELGWFTRVTGLKGVVCDVEDYYRQRQYFRTDADPEWDELVKIVRRRGRQVFGALFRENPDIKVLFLLLLNFEQGYQTSPDPLALAKSRGDLEPAFFDGLLDAMPETARLINGDENSYFADYTARTYHKSCANNYAIQPLFFSPENRAKYVRLSQVSSAFYLDMLVNDLKNPYSLAPIHGSRVEHFRRNLRDATEVATEYVWFWGERHPTIDWNWTPDDGHDTRITGKGTWGENAPGLNAAMKCCKDADRGFARRLAMLKAAGRLKDLNANSACTGQATATGLPAPYQTWGKDAAFSVDTTQGFGDSSCLRMKGDGKTSCIYLSFKDLAPGGSYMVSFACKGPVNASMHVEDKNGRVRSFEHVMFAPGEPDANGWRRANEVVSLPPGICEMTICFGDDTRAKSEIRVDDVHVYPFDFTDQDR